MTQPTFDAETVGKRLKAVLDYVQDCERRVILGEIMDLQGLDNNVIEICDQIAALPRPQAQKLEDQMSLLIEKLEVLAEAMKEQQERYGKAGKA